MGRCVVCSASENPEIQSDYSVVDSVDKNIRMYVLTTQEEICSECYSAIQENLYELEELEKDFPLDLPPYQEKEEYSNRK